MKTIRKARLAVQAALTPEARRNQMVVIAVGTTSVNGSSITEPMFVRFQNADILLEPGKKTLQITREAAEHVIARASRSALKPKLTIVELVPGNELEPEGEDEVGDDNGVDLGEDGEDQGADGDKPEGEDKAPKTEKPAKAAKAPKTGKK